LADLDHSAKANEILVVDFIVAEQVGVVAEVPQKPGELPQGFNRAKLLPSNCCGSRTANLRR